MMEAMKRSVITCLFRGDTSKMPRYSSGKYTPGWVDKLALAVARHSDAEFHVLQDRDYPYNGDFRTHRFIDPEQGWMNLMEVFRPELDLGYCLFLGLDTVLTGRLDDLFGLNVPLVMPRDTEDPKTVNDGALLFAPATGERIFKHYLDKGPAEMRRRYEYGGYLSEMLLLREFWHDEPGSKVRVLSACVRSFFGLLRIWRNGITGRYSQE